MACYAMLQGALTTNLITGWQLVSRFCDVGNRPLLAPHEERLHGVILRQLGTLSLSCADCVCVRTTTGQMLSKAVVIKQGLHGCSSERPSGTNSSEHGM